MEEKELVETTSSQTQHLQAGEDSNDQQHQKDSEMVEAQTQTGKYEGKNQFTQTVAVSLKHQKTQTDFHVKTQRDTSDKEIQTVSGGPDETQEKEDKPEPEHKAAAQTPLKINENAVKDGASSESKPKEETEPSASGAADAATSQPEKDATPKSYAKAVSGGAAGDKQPRPADKTSQSAR